MESLSVVVTQQWGAGVQCIPRWRKKVSIATMHSSRLVVVLVTCAHARLFCEKTKWPLELGAWRHDLKHLDSAVVENRPVSISEGQVYVYENYFPNYTIKYVHVDNLAVKTCGASAAVRNGGLDRSSVLIVLRADANQEIRSVVDIWGERSCVNPPPSTTKLSSQERKNLKSLYLFKGFRTVNHNGGF